ncbi:MAG: hypothetical protein VB111_07650 [Clostridiaceae bacterium]|nr:hypothetical protein [Clostridiaceae bacterium]
MSDTIIVALIAFAGTLAGSVTGVLATSKLTAHRLDRLEKKVDMHNNAVQRLAVVECRLDQITSR